MLAKKLIDDVYSVNLDIVIPVIKFEIFHAIDSLARCASSNCHNIFIFGLNWMLSMFCSNISARKPV